jgi:predicted MFS family arabinose efflux permease
LMFIKADPKAPAEKAVQGLLTQGWNLLKENRAFAHYQILFFLGGAGIIGSQSILPFYFKDSLNLSYTQLGIAFSLCKGLSFVLASPFWSKYANRLSLYHLNSVVNLFTTLFFAFIMAASGNANWLFVAYFFYGAMQAGCEMSWNLSGPFFAGPKESTIYSSLNLACVGIRGCICPFLGYLFFAYAGALPVFMAAALISLIGTAYGLWIGRHYSAEIRPSQRALFFRSKAFSALDPFSAQGTVPSGLKMTASSNSK